MAVAARRYVEIEINASEAIQRLRGIESASIGTERSLSRLESRAASLTRVFRGWAAFEVGSQLVTIGDSAVNVSARLKAVTGSADGATQAFTDLLAIGNRLGISVEDLSNSYAKLGFAVPTASHQELVDTVATLGTVLTRTGSSTQQANAVMLQFSQALGKGRLNGDEFTATVENAPALLIAWRQAMGRTGTALQELSREGAFTTESFLELLPAIIKNLETLVGAEKIPLSVGRAFTILRNELVASFVDVGQQEGAFRELAKAIKAVADVLSGLQPILSTTINLFGSLLNLAGSVLSVFGNIASSVGSSLSAAFNSLTNEMAGVKSESEGLGSFVQVMFGVTLPTEIEVFGLTIKNWWADFRAEIELGVAYLTKAFRNTLLGAQRVAKELEILARRSIRLDTSQQQQSLRELDRQMEINNSTYRETKDLLIEQSRARAQDIKLQRAAIELKYQDTIAQRELNKALDQGIEKMEEKPEERKTPTEVASAVEQLEKIGTTGAGIARGRGLDLGDVALEIRDMVGLAQSGDTEAAQQSFIDMSKALDELSKSATGLDLKNIEMERDRLLATARDVLGEDLSGRENPIIKEMKEGQKWAEENPIQWEVDLNMANAIEHAADQVGYRP